MKKSCFALTIFALFLSSFMASAEQTGDTNLVNAYPGNTNTKLIEFKDIKSPQVKAAFAEVDLAFEMGDGYYDIVKSAYYMVFSRQGKLLGFMNAALMSYTEDPELYLVAAFVNLKGERVGEVHNLSIYMNGYEDDALADLPAELRP